MIRTVRGGVAALAATAVAFAVLAVLVAAGAFTALDEYALQHWMPNLNVRGPNSPKISGYLFHPHLGGAIATFCNLWTFPASVFASALLLAACCAVLVRRGRRDAALVWAVVWVAANAVELIGKLFVYRPMLHATVDGVTTPPSIFAHSFPSGHTIRALLLAALIVSLWRRAFWPALLWALVVLPALVLNASHVPSDVLGGAVVALLAVLAVQTLLRASPRLGYLGARPLVGER